MIDNKELLRLSKSIVQNLLAIHIYESKQELLDYAISMYEYAINQGEKPIIIEAYKMAVQNIELLDEAGLQKLKDELTEKN